MAVQRRVSVLCDAHAPTLLAKRIRNLNLKVTRGALMLSSLAYLLGNLLYRAPLRFITKSLSKVPVCREIAALTPVLEIVTVVAVEVSAR